MSKSERVPDYLGHIIAAIQRIERHISDVDQLEFLNSELIQDAVVRNIEIIGEAARKIQRIDAAFAARHDQIPWQVMYAMRNRLAHDYDQVDYEIVWNLICNELPELYQQLQVVIASEISAKS